MSLSRLLVAVCVISLLGCGAEDGKRDSRAMSARPVDDHDGHRHDGGTDHGRTSPLRPVELTPDKASDAGPPAVSDRPPIEAIPSAMPPETTRPTPGAQTETPKSAAVGPPQVATSGAAASSHPEPPVAPLRFQPHTLSPNGTSSITPRSNPLRSAETPRTIAAEPARNVESKTQPIETVQSQPPKSPDIAPRVAASDGNGGSEVHPRNRPGTKAAPAVVGTEGTEPARDIASESQPAFEQDDDHTVVTVFYGTDRQALDADFSQSPIDLAIQYGPASAAGLLTLLLGAASLFASRRRKLVVLALIGLVATLVLGYPALEGYLSDRRAEARAGARYGNDRGELEVGTCRVSIPKDHQVGEVESPSILKLEINEDVRRHVVLLDTEAKPASAFHAELAEIVSQSPRQELLVFIHGYNVTFDDAARRTAQIAYDLKFSGAPVMYSWPSQGGLLKYTYDETNAQWTVPNLKKFLLDVATNSGAKSINLIAHSMGNRPLTSALRELELELRDEARLFNQVVLAAPDIDAEVFRRDIAPAIARTAKHVTLYASSNDQALVASKKVHGYARAGESGVNVVVLPDIETVDVSALDTSLLGHSYYGSSDSVLADMFHLIQDARPARDRPWLRPMMIDRLTYWVFPGMQPETARADGEAARQ